jgi:hypothetical protein
VSEQRLTPAVLTAIAARAKRAWSAWQTETDSEGAIPQTLIAVPALLVELAAVTGERDEYKTLMQKAVTLDIAKGDAVIDGLAAEYAAKRKAWEAELADAEWRVGEALAHVKRLDNENQRLMEMQLETYERADKAEAALATEHKLSDKAIVLVAEMGLLLVVAGHAKERIFGPWLSESKRLVRTPRAQAALDAALAGKEASDAKR